MDTDRIVRSRLVTRGYELSSSGVLPVSAYLRYLEHTRWGVLLSSGPLSLGQYLKLAVVRAERLELYHQVSFDVELELSTWVSRVGRTSVDLSHELTRVEDGVLVGRAGATLVAIDAERRPTPLDERARELVVERPVPAAEPLPSAVPSDVWTMPIVIRPSDQDLQQHVNHARYADFADDVRIVCARAGGYGPGPWETPVARLLIDFEREARLGQPLAAHTWRLREAPHALAVELSGADGAVVTRVRMDLQEPHGSRTRAP